MIPEFSVRYTNQVRKISLWGGVTSDRHPRLRYFPLFSAGSSTNASPMVSTTQTNKRTKNEMTLVCLPAGIEQRGANGLFCMIAPRMCRAHCDIPSVTLQLLVVFLHQWRVAVLEVCAVQDAVQPWAIILYTSIDPTLSRSVSKISVSNK